MYVCDAVTNKVNTVSGTGVCVAMSRAVLPGYRHTVSCGLQSCGRWALHPYNAEAAARHADECAARHERLAAAARRQARLHTQFFMLPVLVVSHVATF